ncbi:BON domain-containing protein [Planctomicrobium sp. SH664]|uniref:BON domain-containing protein n=1 Tax=Planctomicrobium sp. SH664 TaxID=3448125 RepID=UPI003F5C9DB2
MLLPRKWALGLGLLAAAPSLTVAGPLDSAKPGTGKPEAAAQSPEMNNQQVAEKIAQALGKAKLVHKNVQIEYKSGTATISGEIKDASQRALVTKIASTVPEVQTVENLLQLMEVSTPAAGRPVQQAAAVHSEAQSVQRADFQGNAARGVRQVSYDPQTTMSNQSVAQSIADSLTSAGLSGYDIEVRFKSGIASLIGSVDDKNQVMRAEQAAGSVPGVNQVLNRLTVRGRPVDIQANGGFNPQYAQGPQMGGYPGQQQGYPIQQVQGQGMAPPAMAQGMPPGMHPGMAPGVPPQPMGAGMPQYGNVQQTGHHMYNQPNLPENAWPTYAAYDNSAAITYPSQYDASAWPYIGPYYPYPQVPMGWRKSTLEWDDGNWSLKFDSKTDKWWWFLNPHNWH